MADYDHVKTAAFDETSAFRTDATIFNLDLPHVEKLTYFALTCFEQTCNRPVTYKELAEAVSCSESRVLQAVNNLKNRGLVPPRLKLSTD